MKNGYKDWVESLPDTERVLLKRTIDACVTDNNAENPKMQLIAEALELSVKTNTAISLPNAMLTGERLYTLRKINDYITDSLFKDDNTENTVALLTDVFTVIETILGNTNDQFVKYYWGMVKENMHES